MADTKVDIAIVGGGLAGGLTALAIHRAHPGLCVALFEAGDVLGGNHRWSWFESDLCNEGEALLAPFRITQWNAGYEVRFPRYGRTLGTGYRSLSSKDFDAGLRRLLRSEIIRVNSPVAELAADRVTLRNGETINARAVVDCRTFEPTAHLSGGWQVFLGRHLRTAEPHGLDHPIVMDARVSQQDGYRFVYTLPLGANELFVEDTYYRNDPTLDRDALSSRIDTYCREQGWEVETLGGEAGVLPVITHGDDAAHRAAMTPQGVALIGARGLFSHPLTSYTLPIAVEMALAIAREAALPGSQLAALIDDRARAHWANTRFYRLLGRMLFDAARPEDRYRVFERFYGLRAPLIERFYAARSSPGDKLRILAGKPPVPVHRAVSALLGKGTPLVQGTRR
ncbi:MAG: lycopene beta-cyclase CrtY [Qipengyuania sp.]